MTPGPYCAEFPAAPSPGIPLTLTGCTLSKVRLDPTLLPEIMGFETLHLPPEIEHLGHLSIP